MLCPYHTGWTSLHRERAFESRAPHFLGLLHPQRHSLKACEDHHGNHRPSTAASALLAGPAAPTRKNSEPQTKSHQTLSNTSTWPHSLLKAGASPASHQPFLISTLDISILPSLRARALVKHWLYAATKVFCGHGYHQ